MLSLPLALLLGLPGGTPPTTSGGLILCNEPVVGVGTCRPINVPGAPGPAPLLGVAAGFHWSRQLRRRIKEAS